MMPKHDSHIDELKTRLLRGEIDDVEYNRLFQIVSLDHTWIKPWLNEWLPLMGALAFGTMVGCIVQQVLISSNPDGKLLASIVGVVGGGAVTALFPARSILFGSYSIGLALGFFITLLLQWIEPTHDVAECGAFRPPLTSEGKEKTQREFAGGSRSGGKASVVYEGTYR